MSTIELIRKFYEDFNRHDLDAIEGACTEDVQYTDMVTGGTFDGPKGFRMASERWVAAFPDARIEILRQVVAGDTVITEMVGHGTHQGPLDVPGAGTVPPSGNQGELHCCEILRVQGDRIVSGSIYYDSLTLLRQIGVGVNLTVERRVEPVQPST
jgi:steroid delta-isomerase-like uncharacterized protein